MVNCACAFSQSETEKYFERIIIINDVGLNYILGAGASVKYRLKYILIRITYT